jgi:3',5'-cyclic AMP phosphodiesterase CpdA
MRLLVTADLHYNHPRSRRLADELIHQLNAIPADVLLLVGDTATSAGTDLEACLSRFVHPGPKLFVPGNHELWTSGPDSYLLLQEELPRRVRAMGWQWLQTDPFVTPACAIVGSVGWYDYSFAPDYLNIPRRFYEHKLSPGAAEHFPEFSHLLTAADDVSPEARTVYARWNDGRFIRLHRSDEGFLDELLQTLDAQLASLVHVPQIVAAIHHLPFRQLLPPPHTAAWDFAKAFLGSDRLGQILLKHPNVCYVLCGHTHRPAEARIGHIHAIDIGSGYRSKSYRLLTIA